ncbi:hypothetical protein IFM89_025905 [Coptis chinensis]|uniref:Uncharacterized protein n=1 Tax=Coptis chinensis TaxID=261450 RepID=A0A835HPR7_9MAGN|nr:hypothetical protein IFM89_025905 [Coptis chinensis]
MMDVHRKKSVGEDIYEPSQLHETELGLTIRCADTRLVGGVVVIVPYHIAETVVVEASLLPETKFREVGVSIIRGDWPRTQIGEASRVPDTYGVSIVGGETLETQFLEASRVPDTYGVSIVVGETLQNQFVEASLIPDTCGAGVDVLSSQHVREHHKSCHPRPDQVRSASTLIIPDIPTNRVVVNGLGSECAPGKETSESEGKGHVSVGLRESSLTPGGFTSLIQQVVSWRNTDVGRSRSTWEGTNWDELMDSSS